MILINSLLQTDKSSKEFLVSQVKTNLSWLTEEKAAAGAAGSTDMKGDFSVVDDWLLASTLLNSSILLRANSHVSRTS